MFATSTVFPASDNPSSLVVSIDWVQGAVILHGDLDRDSAHHLLDALAALTGAAHPRWVVDTAAVTWCDAGGLRALAAAQVLARESGRSLHLVRPARCVQRLVTLTGLDELLVTDRPAQLAPGTAELCTTGRS